LIPVAAEPIARKGGPAIKIGCAAYSYRRYLQGADASMTMESFLDTAAEIGCEGVELTSYYWPPDFDLKYTNKLKRRALVLGLDICATSVGNKFSVPPGAERDKNLDLVKTWIKRAAEMGAPCMRIFGGAAPKDSTEGQAMAWIVECIQECLPLAEQHGVVLALENHGGVTTTAKNLIAIVKAVDSDWLGVNLDTGNFATADPYADIAEAAPYAVTTHFKTEVHPAGKDKQPLDLKRTVDILRGAGYRGYVTLEYEASEDPKTAVPKALEALKQIIL
jgi:sugar phosphate isomerase/epimerase